MIDVFMNILKKIFFNKFKNKIEEPIYRLNNDVT